MSIRYSAARAAASTTFALALTLSHSTPAGASPPEHGDFSETEDSVVAFPAGGGQCVPYPGTMAETRTLNAKFTYFADGPKAGQVHVVAHIDGTISVEPTDPDDGAAYIGGYSERNVFAGVFDDAGERTLRNRYQLNVQADGSDGSTLHYIVVGNFLATRDGQIRIDNDRIVCAGNDR